MDAPVSEAGIYARESSYLECWVQIGAAGQKVISCSFPETPDEYDEDYPLMERIDAYLRGDEVDFADVDVGLTVPTNHRNVLDAVRQVPYGQNATVEQITRMVPGMDPDDEDDHVTVRQALADNPVPLVIPDHRIRDGPSAAPPAIEQKLRSLETL